MPAQTEGHRRNIRGADLTELEPGTGSIAVRAVFPHFPHRFDL